jgi:UPF0271 protein
MRVDLNADLGEGFGDDSGLLGIVSSANIAAGAHAGGGQLLERAVADAVRHGVAVGAHPSYRDRDGFGRRSELDGLRDDPAGRARLVADVVGQVLLVADEVERCGVGLAHVKAHGALYNEAVVDRVAAELVVEAVTAAARSCGHSPALMTQPGGALARLAAQVGLVVRAEGFVDRGYRASGSLVPRGEPGALLVDPVAMTAQALALASGRVRSVDGPWVDVPVDSLCVHGDTPGALAAARSVRSALEGAGWRIAAPANPT